MALARIHDREALPQLVRLLDDRDPDILAFAVGGLARFANNIPFGQHYPAPGAWPLRAKDAMAHYTTSPVMLEENPSKYVRFWKDWWRHNQAEVMALAR